MAQSRIGSLTKALINTLIGFISNLALVPLVFAVFGWTIGAGQGLAFVTVFTVISVVRGYCIRRWFDARIRRKRQLLQTPLGSLNEAMTNTLLGFAINLLANPVVFWWLGREIKAAQNIAFIAVFTLLNLVRSYCVRRCFNARIRRFAYRLTA
jgi:predicted Na+-dependent transporter